MLEGMSALDAPKKDGAIRLAFAHVPLTDEGMLMLVTVLDNLFYFAPAHGEGEQECNNVAKYLLSLCPVEVASRVYGAWKNVMSENENKKEL
jgi:hypothetical protein